MKAYQTRFIELAIARGALRFGHFRLKSGRESPYFFDAAAFSDGQSMATLASCYADALADSGMPFDVLFGPAYKGIPLVTAVAIALAQHHARNVPYAFNRKEAKDHGEGGNLIGAPLSGRVVIVDDVITVGTAIRGALELIRSAGAQPAGIVLALDRQERGQGARSAVQDMEIEHGLKCVSVVTLTDLIEALATSGLAAKRISPEQLAALRDYQARYGVTRSG